MSPNIVLVFPDDVYRRKQSEREYQQKITEGLNAHNEPAAKWMTGWYNVDFTSVVQGHILGLILVWNGLHSTLLGYNNHITFVNVFKESRVKSWWRNGFQHAGFIVNMIYSLTSINSNNITVNNEMISTTVWYWFNKVCVDFLLNQEKTVSAIL